VGEWSVVAETPAASDWSVVHDTVDAGPEARHKIFGRPKMPEPKTDEALGISAGPLFGDISGSPTRTQLAKNAPGTDAYAAQHAGDEMHDPIAQAITAGAMAAPLAAVAGSAAPAALAPLVSGAVSGGQQAAMVGQNPLTGALLGAIPGIPAAAVGAERALGAAALTRATSPGFGTGPGPIAKAAGHAVGAAVGAPIGGLPGAYIGDKLIGGKAASLFSKADAAATNALARRYVSQELSGAVSGAPMVDLQAARNTFQLPEFGAPRATGFSAEMPPIPTRPPLAPLVPQPRPLPPVPPGAFGAPFLDEISGMPVTQAGQGGFLPGEAATAVGKAPRRLQIQDASGRDLLESPPETPSLRADTIRDARKFLDQPYDVEPSQKGRATPSTAGTKRPDLLYDAEKAPETLESQLERSVRMLSELKSAARAGKATPAMVQEAIQAGMSPHAVAKAVGRETFERATQ
jgi:hypothetical protein